VDDSKSVCVCLVEKVVGRQWRLMALTSDVDGLSVQVEAGDSRRHHGQQFPQELVQLHRHQIHLAVQVTDTQELG